MFALKIQKYKIIIGFKKYRKNTDYSEDKKWWFMFRLMGRTESEVDGERKKERERE